MVEARQLSSRIRGFRWIFLILAWGLIACIVVQTYLAGMAIFDDPSRWRTHVNFVHIFEFIPLLMIVFAHLGKLPIGTGWLCLAQFGLIYFQYFTANLPGAGALHPVMALVLIVLSLYVVKRAGGVVFVREGSQG
ncbi:DUF6220 domain-containing protein [Paenibacillus mendelii]|uniref:DUF6220 domain-containing protein n=1 Tax=Paenibacillus mendelii TaxID=206163 RepID=A0ABV6J595_9BACL|nr:DUF6220 domain-containing protein [Paenibacillus mendelii]MCQ6560257.1 DUF6220 domain-containing protein [Paenibacillus mendelii]